MNVKSSRYYRHQQHKRGAVRAPCQPAAASAARCQTAALFCAASRLKASARPRRLWRLPNRSAADADCVGSEHAHAPASSGRDLVATGKARGLARGTSDRALARRFRRSLPAVWNGGCDVNPRGVVSPASAMRWRRAGAGATPQNSDNCSPSSIVDAAPRRITGPSRRATVEQGARHRGSKSAASRVGTTVPVSAARIGSGRNLAERVRSVEL